MEGKFCRERLQALQEDDDMLTAMARELVPKTVSASLRIWSGVSATS
jgi:hypothetical protein